MKPNPESKKNLRFFHLITTLILVGLILIFSARIANYLVRVRSEITATSGKTELVANIPADTNDFDYSKVTDYDLHSLVSGINLQKVHKLGRISIPKYNVNIPIVHGISNTALLVGAGTLTPDQALGTGNYALAGHNVHDNKTLFAPLERAKKGALIYASDTKNTYVYKINAIHIIEPTKIGVITQTYKKPAITLLLCTPDGRQRIQIVGELVTRKAGVTTTTSEKNSKTQFISIILLFIILICGLMYLLITRVKRFGLG
ncbi:class A sortase [Periweissella cryptocerci]|uniref:Class A sortase n=1 Tax=Periweissella cryptocerci TaxID=2506420 RepID=A0A4P6YQZ3_9LACO|nr:class A sortase [Periweissella cryptocerci]QBO35039.1 class A sortase [Periweissella cryptocerci]